MSNNPVQILLVEDDEVDAEAIQRAFDKHKIANHITRAHDGIEALQFLRREGADALPRPFIILLDLNMPRMNGIEFLQEIRGDSTLTECIVFVLTTSNAERDKTSAYREHISGYILKSNVGDGFTKLVDLMGCYWKIIEMPENVGNSAKTAHVASRSL